MLQIIHFILSIMDLWIIFGVVWGLHYNVFEIKYKIYKVYKKTSIFIGGPIWWVICMIEVWDDHRCKILSIFQPEKK